MDGYDQGFRGGGGFGRGIDRNSYDYQYGANPEAYRPAGRGGYGRDFGGRSFVGDEVGSNAGEFGQGGGYYSGGQGGYGGGYYSGGQGGYGGAYSGPGYGGGYGGYSGGQGYGGGYGQGFGGGTFIGAEGGVSAGYGRDEDDFAGQDERFQGGYSGGFGPGFSREGFGRGFTPQGFGERFTSEGFASQVRPQQGGGGGYGTYQRGGGSFSGGGGYGDYQRGALGGDYEAGNYGGFRGVAGRGYGGYGADYGLDMSRYDVDYGGSFMGGISRGTFGGGYDAGFGSFGARSGGLESGFGGGRGYDAGFGGYAQGPFMPEEAYTRHPEYNQPPQRRGMHTEGYGYSAAIDEDFSDDQVLHAVRSRIQQDRWLDADRINVEVEDGIVTLTGEVGDFMEARYAWDDAWETPGVHGVVNSLTVRTDLPHDAHGDVMPQSSGGHGSGGG